MRHQGLSWEEIRDRIDDEIASGRLLPDMRLPSEPEMCVLYKTRRHSLRKALAALVAEGKLRVEQGRGTFVERAPLIDYVIGARTRFRANLMAQGLAASDQRLEEMRIPASPRVAAALRILAGAQVHARSGRGFANELPINLSWSYWDAGRFPDIIERLRTCPSVTDVYGSYGIADYRRLRTTIFTRIASETEAGLLMLRPGQSVMVVQKIDATLDGTPIGFSEAAWAGDRVQFTFDTDPVSSLPVERKDHV